jgi:hypothetical protein
LFQYPNRTCKEFNLATAGSDPAAAKEAEARYLEAANTKTEVDGAIGIARGQEEELQNEFDALKKKD